MTVKHRIKVTADAILQDPAFTALPVPPSRTFVSQQLRDPGLCATNLQALTNMDFEEMIHRLFVSSGQEEQGVIPPAPAPADDEDDEGARILVSLDSMAVTATIVLREPGPGEEPPTEEEIRAALRARGVVEGVRDEFIIRLAEHPIYGKRFRIAEGVMPVNGTDGSAVFHFDQTRSLTLEPATLEEKDFEEVEFAEYVEKGDLLCELIPPTAATPGVSVMGDSLPGSNGAPSPVKAGTNAVFSEDGSKIYASCDGQVFYKNHRVGVSRVMMLDRVDQSTGNILFVGSVLVRGDVEDGRRIQAGGNITVCGHVKDAVIASGRNLILVNGITGQGNALISAEGSIRARFIESSRVKAGVNLYADIILNADVECGGEVVLFGKYGRMVGGVCRAGLGVTANQIGNRASIRTVVHIEKRVESGTLLGLQAQLARFQETDKSLERIIGSIVNLGAPFRTEEHIVSLIRAVYIRKQFEEEIRFLKNKLEESRQGMTYPGYVTARNSLFSDVYVNIYGANMETKTEMGPCTVSRTGNRLILSGPRTDTAPERGDE